MDYFPQLCSLITSIDLDDLTPLEFIITVFFRSLLLDMHCQEVAGALRGLIFPLTVVRVGLKHTGTKNKVPHMWLVT